MKFLIFIFLFNFIFGPRLKIADILLLTASIASLFAIYNIFIVKRKIPKELAKIIVIFLFPLFYAFLIVGLNNFQDTTGLELIFKTYLYLFGSYFVITLYDYKYSQEGAEKLLKHIYYSGILNAILTLLIYFNNSFRNYMISILNYSSTQQRWAIEGRRVFDISMGGGSSASTVFSIIFVIGIYVLFTNKEKIINVIGLTVILGSIIVTGRSGLFIIILGAPIYLSLITKKKFKKSFVGFTNIKRIILIISILILLIVLTFQNDTLNKLNDSTIRWAFESFYNLGKGAGLSSASMNRVFDSMYFLPSEVMHLFFGNSNFGRSDSGLAYISSDVGYIRTIFGMGIIGLVVMYLPYLFILKYSFFRKNKIHNSLLLYNVVIIFVINFKELHYMPRGGGSLLLLLLSINFMKTNLNENRFLKKNE